MTNYLDFHNTGASMDLSEHITNICPCGSVWFRTIVQIDDDYEISAYGLDGECIECGTRVKLPCPVDKDSSN